MTGLLSRVECTDSFMLLVKDDCQREVTDQGYRSKGVQDPRVLVNLAPSLSHVLLLSK